MHSNQYNSQVNNKRIAKNTVYLYFRMLVLLIIGLFTSRVNLNALGIDNYGIYNLVGGIVVILGFLNSSMAAAVQRFLNFEMGRGSYEGVVGVFKTSQTIHLILAGIILIVAETIGLWFLNFQLVIPSDRIFAANCVYQFSILSFLISVVSVPYNAAIISHEKMSAFAYITILEAIAKLLVAYLIYVSPIDKLIFYAALLCITSIVIRITYQIYCHRHFEECKNFSLSWEKDRLKKMLSFSSWIIIGALSNIFHTQGISIVVNIFFGVTLNAALGIANQVNGLVRQFLQNFTLSMNPQLTKSYSAGNLSEMHKLLIRGSKMALALVSFFALPILIEAPTILELWLKTVPDYTVIFIRVLMIITICDSFSAPLACSQNSTGNLKKYQTVLTTLSLLHIPLAFLFFSIGKGPEYAMYSYLGIVVCMQIVRIYFVGKSIHISILRFCKSVILRGGTAVLVSLGVTLSVKSYLPTTLLSSFITCVIVCASTVITAFFMFEKEERIQIFNIIKAKTLHK